MSNFKTKIPVDWDVDVIDYWNASLSSYEIHHQDPHQEVDADKVTSEFIESLPVKQIIVEQSSSTTEIEPVIPNNATNNKAQAQAQAQAQSAAPTAAVKRKVAAASAPKIVTPPTAATPTQIVEEESKVGNWTFVEPKNKEKQVPIDEEEVEEEQEYDEEENEYIGEEDTSRKPKKARYDNHQYGQDQAYDYSNYYNQQQQAPPQLPMMPQSDEGLSNLIMAWYYAGYYTGLYQAGAGSRR